MPRTSSKRRGWPKADIRIAVELNVVFVLRPSLVAINTHLLEPKRHSRVALVRPAAPSMMRQVYSPHICGFLRRLKMLNHALTALDPTKGRVIAINCPPSFDTKAFLAKIGEGRSIGRYRKDQIVFSQGGPADAVFYIQSGKVKNTVVSEQGKEAVVALLGTGDFFGEGCLTGQRLRLATVRALTDCVTMRITKADITRVIHEEPAFAELFIAHLLSRNLRVEEDLVDQLFNSSEKRLARMLLLLANFGKEGQPELIIAKISQDTLADMIGTTRSRVSFFMNKFRELGFIDYTGQQIKVHSSLLNMVLHDKPEIRH